MATPTEKKADNMIFKSGTRKRLEADLAKALNQASWKDTNHRDHLRAVDEVHRLYKQAHRSK